MTTTVYDWHYINPKAIHEFDFFSESNSSLEGFFTSSENTKKPEWFNALDQVKTDLLNEIDISLQHGLHALPTMGLRALIDLVVVDKIGDIGSFTEKTKVLCREGFISTKQRDLIDKVLEAGNAASHRAYLPEKVDLRTLR